MASCLKILLQESFTVKLMPGVINFVACNEFSLSYSGVVVLFKSKPEYCGREI